MTNAAQNSSAYIVNAGASAGNSMGNNMSNANAGNRWSSSNAQGASNASAESVAYSLMLSIACAEGVVVNTATGLILGGANRQWILNTYAECLATVNGCASQYGQVSNFRQAG